MLIPSVGKEHLHGLVGTVGLNWGGLRPAATCSSVSARCFSGFYICVCQNEKGRVNISGLDWTCMLESSGGWF